MEARLIIALDDEFKIYKTLKTMELMELDAFMVNNFENSDMVRECSEFKEKIESFLTDNQAYIRNCSRKNNGYIRVIYTDDKGTICPIKAYYKRDKKKLNMRSVKADIKRKCVEDLSLLKEVYLKHRYQMPGFHKDSIGSMLKGSKISRSRLSAIINDWVELIADKKEGYFYIRRLNRTIEKYIEAKQKSERIISIKNGEIKNIDCSLFGSDKMSLQNMEPDVVRFMKTVEDPDELFSSFDLDDLYSIDVEDLPSYVKKKRN